MLDDLVDNPIGGGGPCRHPYLLNTRKPTLFNFTRGFDMENADSLFTANVGQMGGIRGILSPDDDHRLRFGLAVFRRLQMVLKTFTSSQIWRHFTTISENLPYVCVV